MLLLRLTSPESVIGLTSDDGFEIGVFSVRTFNSARAQHDRRWEARLARCTPGARLAHPGSPARRALDAARGVHRRRGARARRRRRLHDARAGARSPCLLFVAIPAAAAVVDRAPDGALDEPRALAQPSLHRSSSSSLPRCGIDARRFARPRGRRGLVWLALAVPGACRARAGARRRLLGAAGAAAVASPLCSRSISSPSPPGSSTSLAPVKAPQPLRGRRLPLVVLGLGCCCGLLAGRRGAARVRGGLLTGAVRGWRFPGSPPPARPAGGLSAEGAALRRDRARVVGRLPGAGRDARRADSRSPFSGLRTRGRAASGRSRCEREREPASTCRGERELTFFRADGRLVHERVGARWSRQPAAAGAAPLEPEHADGCARRRARVDRRRGARRRRVRGVRAHGRRRCAAARRLRHRSGRLLASRLRRERRADEPLAWYRLRVPLMRGSS